MPDPRHLFVYRTLRPTLAPPLIRDIVLRLVPAGPATIPGRLYDLGRYPGCKLDPTGDAQIHGQLLELPDPKLLVRLDWYEDYVASDEAGSLFVRRTAIANLADGRALPAWVYEYNRTAPPARLISSGRYDARKPLPT